jgi:hypothetical protein
MQEDGIILGWGKLQDIEGGFPDLRFLRADRNPELATRGDP